MLQPAAQSPQNDLALKENQTKSPQTSAFAHDLPTPLIYIFLFKCLPKEEEIENFQKFYLSQKLFGDRYE